MRTFFCALLALFVVTSAAGQDNPLARSSNGDWVKYLVTTKNETEPLLSSKDLPRWKAITNVGPDFVRIDDYMFFGGRRVGGGGSIAEFKNRYEPVPGIVQATKVQVTSTTKEKLTINGKSYSCTKLVRKIDQRLDENTLQTGWSGTSTLWLCNDIPLGLAKMENAYHSRLVSSDAGQKVVETWIVTEFGFKNWKED